MVKNSQTANTESKILIFYSLQNPIHPKSLSTYTPHTHTYIQTRKFSNLISVTNLFFYFFIFYKKKNYTMMND